MFSFVDSRDLALIWALHGYLVPTNKLVKKDPTTSKKVTTKFTIKDSQQSVVFYGKNLQEVEERINHLKETKMSIQPSIYCVGDSIFSIKDIFVIFDDIRYKFSSLIKALDICFKTIYLFDLEFPPESVTFYSFIEAFFFDMKTPNHSKVSVLCEFLKQNYPQ